MYERERLQELSVKGIFSSERYSIPIYQRNYAWREPQIRQLIQDVVDCLRRAQSENYYIGTLVVYKRLLPDATFIYDVIDGQQRLTTLSLLLCVIKSDYDAKKDSGVLNDMLGWFRETNLSFESRQASTEALSSLFRTGKIGLMSDNGIESDLLIGFNIARKSLYAVLKEYGVELASFLDFLLERVFILRVPVPKDTDLNHYFEIMNSRGEQLERHEILKAHLMGVLKMSPNSGRERARIFGLIWDACSEMDRYIQMRFDAKGARNGLFGESWDELQASSFEEILDKLIPPNGKSDSRTADRMSLQKLVEEARPVLDDEDGSRGEGDDSRFKSIINFQNFLLQVLRVYTGEDVPMDDKRLVDEFKERLKTRNETEKIRFVEEFGFALLKCRYLFDRYVIKREYDERWRAQRLKRQEKDPSKVYYVSTFGKVEEGSGENGEQREVEMLLAMFHVSHPTMIYKHWLNAVLLYLYRTPRMKVSSYRQFLEDLAEKFLANRFLSQEPIEYYDLIYKGVAKSSSVDESLLDKGTEVENFIFNFLDYKLWKQCRNKFPTFEFTSRSSVEHYYPQHPMDGVPPLEESVLNSFGNLCLISASRNSRLSNFSPTAKKDFFRSEPRIESIKQRLMMEDCNDPWNANAIAKHGEEMKKVLLSPSPASSCDRETLLDWMIERIKEKMLESGFRWNEEACLSDDSLDDVSCYFEKDGQRIAFCSEGVGCGAMYVGIHRSLVAQRISVISHRLPDWMVYDKWCWKPLSEEFRNWDTAFLSACKTDQDTLVSLLTEISKLINDAYKALTSQVL